MPPVKLVTFDCYGTLVDWEGGIATFLYDLARRSGEEEPEAGRELRRRWEAIQFELIQGDYRSYREVLAESLRAWARERGYRWEPQEGVALERAMEAWQPFPDTVPSLLRAQAAGAGLAIVSNTDRSIIRHTLRQLHPVEFDEVVVAEDVRAYKPAIAPFTRLLEQARVDGPHDCLHVAFGFKYEILPAKQLGMRTAWVNRHRDERPDAEPSDAEPPDHEWDSLWGLAELVGGA